MKRASPIFSLAVATACLHAAQAPAVRFSGDRAYEHVRQLVTIGPRPAGSAGALKAREYIKGQLASLELAVVEQTFDTTTPIGTIKMVNLRATVPAAVTNAARGRVIVAGHYDTKLFRDFPFVGANDGGSSAAFLIELARVLKTRSNALPIELLFLDGEEAVIEWQGGDHTYGSRHYVEVAKQDGTLKNIRALILVDMVGDKDLRIRRESNSTGWLTDAIWAAARRLKRPEFAETIVPIEDDHLSFLEAGVPAVDIIDLEYAAWHTREDTLDKVSARSLEIVGEVLIAALPDIEKHLAGR